MSSKAAVSRLSEPFGIRSRSTGDRFVSIDPRQTTSPEFPPKAIRTPKVVNVSRCGSFASKSIACGDAMIRIPGRAELIDWHSWKPQFGAVFCQFIENSELTRQICLSAAGSLQARLRLTRPFFGARDQFRFREPPGSQVVELMLGNRQKRKLLRADDQPGLQQPAIDDFLGRSGIAQVQDKNLIVFLPDTVDASDPLLDRLTHHNDDPKPFVWTKPADAILAKLDRLPVSSF